MARDVYIRLDRRHEICEAQAFAEVRRRNDDSRPVPEKRLARALLASFDLFDYAVRQDEKGEVLTPKEADAISARERAETAHLLAEIRELARRYPPLVEKRLTRHERPARQPRPATEPAHLDVRRVPVGLDVLEPVLADPGARGVVALHARRATSVHE